MHCGLPSYSNSSKFPEPSPVLTMLTLLIVTIPVEIIFLTILDVLDWLNLPLLFVSFSVVFFRLCCEFLHGSSYKYKLITNNWLGIRITGHRPSSYKLPLV